MRSFWFLVILIYAIGATAGFLASVYLAPPAHWSMMLHLEGE